VVKVRRHNGLRRAGCLKDPKCTSAGAAAANFRSLLPSASSKVDLAITIDRLLDELAKTKPEWCDLVEVKYFLGLTDEEAADVLGVKLRTMQRTWRDARRWLFEQTESVMASNFHHLMSTIIGSELPALSQWQLALQLR